MKKKNTTKKNLMIQPLQVQQEKQIQIKTSHQISRNPQNLNISNNFGKKDSTPQRYPYVIFLIQELQRTPPKLSPKRNFDQYFHPDQFQHVSLSPFSQANKIPKITLVNEKMKLLSEASEGKSNRQWKSSQSPVAEVSDAGINSEPKTPLICKSCRWLQEKLRINLEVNNILRTENDNLGVLIKQFQSSKSENQQHDSELKAIQQQLKDYQDTDKGLKHALSILKKDQQIKETLIKDQTKKIQDLCIKWSGNIDFREAQQLKDNLISLQQKYDEKNKEFDKLQTMYNQTQEQQKKTLQDLRVEFILKKEQTNKYNEQYINDKLIEGIESLIIQYKNKIKDEDSINSSLKKITENSENSESGSSDSESNTSDKAHSQNQEDQSSRSTSTNYKFNNEKEQVSDTVQKKLLMLESAIKQSLELSQKKQKAQSFDEKNQLSNLMKLNIDQEDRIKLLEIENKLFKNIKIQNIPLVNIDNLETLQNTMNIQLQGIKQNLNTMTTKTLEEHLDMLDVYQRQFDEELGFNQLQNQNQSEDIYQNLAKELRLLESYIPDTEISLQSIKLT